jgi:hypothetical protein
MFLLSRFILIYFNSSGISLTETDYVNDFNILSNIKMLFYWNRDKINLSLLILTIELA